MDFEQFQEQAMEAVKEHFPELSVEMQEVNKLQGQSYTGMAVKPEGSNIAATINLQPVFDQVEAGDMVSLYPLWKADDYTGQPRRGQDLLCHASCGGLYQPKAFTRYGDP